MKKNTSYDGGRFTRLAKAMSRNYDVTVKMSGMTACTDGKTIFIPANSDDFCDADAQVLHGLLDHEVAHVWEEAEAKATKTDSPLTLLKYVKENAVKIWFNVFEDVRIERLASKRYIGISENLSVLRDHAVSMHKKAYKRGEVDPWMHVACGAILRMQGRDTKWMGAGASIILDMLEEEINLGKIAASPKDALDLAKRVVEKLKMMAPPDGGDKDKGGKPGKGGKPEPGEGGSSSTKTSEKTEDASSKKTKKTSKKDSDSTENSEGESEKKDSEEESDPTDGGEEESDSTEDSEEESDSEGEGEGDSEGDSEDDGEEESEKNDGNSDKGTGDIEDPRQEDAHDSMSKEDMDAAKKLLDDLKKGDAESADLIRDTVSKDIERKAKAYAKVEGRWLVTPSALKGDRILIADKHTGFYNATKQKVAKQATALKQKLVTLLRARTQKHMSGDRERGSLDTAALYSLKLNNNRVFASPTECNALDTAVFLLLDQSGSMGHEKCTAVAEMTVAISDALDALNVPFEIFGFWNDYCSAVFPTVEEHSIYSRYMSFRFLQFKTFSESFRKVRDRLAEIIGHGENVDGDAVEFAARRLMSRKERRKILIVLSDGTPAGGVTDEARNQQHLLDEVKRATDAGIEVLGIGALTSAVTKFYNKETGAHNIVVMDLNQLAPEAFKAFKSMLSV